MSEKLLPCPFCGGAADFEEISSGLGTTWSIGCQSSEIDCIGYQMLAHFSRKCEAAEAWNKRVPVCVPAAGPNIPCPRCHYSDGPQGAERYWEARWRDADAELTLMKSQVERARDNLNYIAALGAKSHDEVAMRMGNLAHAAWLELSSTERT